jgi:hypothetical protein
MQDRSAIGLHAFREEPVMTQAIAHQPFARQAPRRPTTGRLSRQRALGRMAWQTLSSVGVAAKRAVLAFVNFWNIPVLGPTEGPEAQSIRTIYHN